MLSLSRSEKFACVAIITTSALSVLYLWKFRSGPYLLHGTKWFKLQDLKNRSDVVSLCGIVFNVRGDSAMFGVNGAYESLCGHDTTWILSRGDIDPISVLDKELDGIVPAEEVIIKDLLKRFASMYRIEGMLSDFYADPMWYPLQRSIYDMTHSGPSTCPLGFGGRRKCPQLAENVLDLSNCFVTLCGKKYDVSSSALFAKGGKLHDYVGSDITTALAYGTFMKEHVNTPVLNYTYEQKKRLDASRIQFENLFPIIALVDGEVPTNSDTNLALHFAIENNHVSTITTLLSSKDVNVDAICSRTQLTGLHKAIEQGNSKIVELLLAHGADPHLPAMLYDDKDALELAKHFHQPEIVLLLEQ